MNHDTLPPSDVMSILGVAISPPYLTLVCR